MLQLSSQVTANLAATMGRFSTRFTTANINGFVQCIVLVSDQLAVPRSSQGVLSFINTVLNASTFGGGSAGNEVYCLGIIDQIPDASFITPQCISYNGLAQYTAKQTGRIGSAIITTLLSSSAYAPSTLYPIPQSALISEYNGRSGVNRTDAYRMYNYSFITTSVGVSGNDMIILDEVDVIQGNTYQFYGASFDFKMIGG
jgi:hypothetical protein